MDTQNTMDSGIVDATEGATETVNQSQADGKMFTQAELDAIITKRLSQVTKKYEGVDIEEYQQFKSAQQKREEEQLLKRNEFDKVLKQTREHADGEINRLRKELETVRIDGALVNAASKHRALNPEHVANLLRNQIKLDETGQVVILDENGEVRYNPQTAEQYSVDDLVEEFVNQHPYFKSAGPAGTGSTGNTQTQSVQSMDLQSLDLSKPEHREVYRQMKAKGLV